ncbi:MAG: HoxN/HupN/NixA family nickel/cobalt transporter [Candidatus Eremiobacteraeota bacterium]|nr:HoxN/HupN/NixA family nickel/cobalt transporter [Candidatus Eremiobacteraeota bacterium]
MLKLTRGTRAQAVAMYALLLGGNAIVWIVALLLFVPHHSLLLGTAVLAYTFGLRHAVDADHICAIDNVTRKLMQEGKRPVGVGFFFSLGHSTIVIVLTTLIAVAATTIRQNLPSFEGLGGAVGTIVSAGFLFLIAAINAFVLADILSALREVKRGGNFAESALSESLDRRGVLGRFFKPLLRLVTKSRHMYLIGLLFGLGFDTATEVGLLGIAAIEAGKGLPIWTILIFPALFTAGMSLIDTTDGVLMLGAYGWAFLDPTRKLFYNLTITSASVVVAILVGGLEIAGMLGGGLDAGWLGFAIVGVFIGCWLVSVVLYRIANALSQPGLASISINSPE